MKLLDEEEPTMYFNILSSINENFYNLFGKKSFYNTPSLLWQILDIIYYNYDYKKYHYNDYNNYNGKYYNHNYYKNYDYNYYNYYKKN